MTIGFGQITNNSRLPGSRVEIDDSKALAGQQGAITFAALLIGQKLAAGTGAVDTPLLVSNLDDMKLLAGIGSQAADMFEYFINNNNTVETTVLLIGEGTTAAEKTITVTGPATESGQIAFYVAGRRVVVSVTNGDAATVIAQAIADAIDADPANLYTTAVAVAVVTLTARNQGEWTEKMKVMHSRFSASNGGTEKLPAGVGIVIADTTTGAGNPAIANALAALPDKIFDYIVMGYNDSVSDTALETHLDDSQNANVQHEGHGFNSFKGTQGLSSTHGNANNGKYQTTMHAGVNPVTPEHAFGAAYFGAASKKSMEHPGKQWTGIKLVGVIGDELVDQLTDIERNILLFDGIATHNVLDDGSVVIERGVTNFQTNQSAQPSVAFLDSQTLFILSYMRKTFNSTILPLFEGFLLASDGATTNTGVDVATPKSIKAEVHSLQRIWTNDSIIESFEQARDTTVVTRDSEGGGGDVNRVNIEMSPDIINQFRQLATVIKFIL